MKISDRDKLLILLLILACVIGLPIYFLIVPSNKNIKSYEEEFNNLGERYEYLKGLYENKDFYEAQITSLNVKRDQLIEVYAPGLRQENTIMFLREIELSDKPITMLTESFAPYIETKITDDYVNEAGETVEGLSALSTSTAVFYNGEYEDVKALLDYIFKNNQKMLISSITMTLQENNKIAGTFVLNQFAIVGEGRNLDSCSVPSMEHGSVDNRIFGVNYDENGNPVGSDAEDISEADIVEEIDASEDAE